MSIFVFKLKIKWTNDPRTINTFLETPRPNVIHTDSHCCFEKFRIKRYPNRPSLDYPLDLTKSTNYKKWTCNKENSKFR